MAEPVPAFGRRPPLPRTRAPQAPEQPQATAPDTLEAELAAWKRARPSRPFPWRQFSLMMGLCFGAGSLVLPESINDAARYACYVIAAIAFLGGLGGRRKKAS